MLHAWPGGFEEVFPGGLGAGAFSAVRGVFVALGVIRGSQSAILCLFGTACVTFVWICSLVLDSIIRTVNFTAIGSM